MAGSWCGARLSPDDDDGDDSCCGNFLIPSRAGSARKIFCLCKYSRAIIATHNLNSSIYTRRSWTCQVSLFISPSVDYEKGNVFSVRIIFALQFLRCRDFISRENDEQMSLIFFFCSRFFFGTGSRIRNSTSQQKKKKCRPRSAWLLKMMTADNRTVTRAARSAILNDYNRKWTARSACHCPRVAKTRISLPVNGRALWKRA